MRVVEASAQARAELRRVMLHETSTRSDNQAPTYPTKTGPARVLALV